MGHCCHYHHWCPVTAIWSPLVSYPKIYRVDHDKTSNNYIVVKDDMFDITKTSHKKTLQYSSRAVTYTK
jgi:hypothetical protein